MAGLSVDQQNGQALVSVRQVRSVEHRPPSMIGTEQCPVGRLAARLSFLQSERYAAPDLRHERLLDIPLFLPPVAAR
jgi:hypothetical protein